MYFNNLEFDGVADAMRAKGFAAIFETALHTIKTRYHCDASFDESQFKAAFQLWIELVTRLNLEAYQVPKQIILPIAVMIQAVGSCQIAHFTSIEGNLPTILADFPDELLGLIMGLVLHDLALRTSRSQRTRILYVPLENLDGVELSGALQVMRDKRSTNHRRRFRKLLGILERFNVVEH